MQSIKFLETPCIISEDDSPTCYVRTTIAIVSLLGNTPYTENVVVEASLLSQNNEEIPYLEHSYQWQADSTSLCIVFDITNFNIIWPARIKVGSKNQDIIRLSDVVERGAADEPPKVNINTAWSEAFEPKYCSKIESIVERKFVLSSDRMITIWERFDRYPSSQLRPVGVAMLAYLDSVIANRTDAIPELDVKLASATSKRLHAIDFCNNCGIVGIGLAQLIPDCHVTIFDAPDEGAIVELNIKEMFPAVMSCVEYEKVDSATVESVAKGTRPIDLIFLTDNLYDEECTQSVSRMLTAFLKTSPKVVVLLAQEICHDKKPVFEEVLKQGGAYHCGRVGVPTFEEDLQDENPPIRFSIDVFRGKDPSPRTKRLASISE